jgi:hypothetical protein
LYRTALALFLVGALALLVAAGSPAFRSTTGPTRLVTVVVLITDKGIVLQPYVSVYSESDLSANLQVLRGPIPRGDYVRFNVLNKGKKTHNFKVFGKTTPPVKPGGRAHLFASALVRGSFRYSSTLDKGNAFHGSISVY